MLHEDTKTAVLHAAEFKERVDKAREEGQDVDSVGATKDAHDMINEAFWQVVQDLRDPPPCPWPESVWTMTDEDYVKAVPDPQLRTAISGFLMRKGWEVAMKTGDPDR